MSHARQVARDQILAQRIKGVSVNYFGLSCLHAQLPPHPAQSGVSGVVKQMTPLIEADGLLDVVRHPNSGKYPNQLVFIVALDGYVLLVPFVDEPEYYFLKTIIPSRKATRDYLLRRSPDETL